MEKNIKEEQKQEAIRRIKELQEKYHLNSNMLDYFEKGDILGVNFTTEKETPEEADFYDMLIAYFQKTYSGMVYYFTVEEEEYMSEHWKTLNIFYVGANKEDWKWTNSFEDDCAYVYSYNLDVLECSEFGYIMIEADNGDLRRKKWGT